MGWLLYKGRVYVPEDAALRAEIRMLCHDDWLAGHFGVEKTLALAKRDFYWPEMDDDLERYVETCALCQFKQVKATQAIRRVEASPCAGRCLAGSQFGLHHWAAGMPPR
jgi:hypothetical protein